MDDFSMETCSEMYKKHVIVITMFWPIYREVSVYMNLEIFIYLEHKLFVDW